MRPPDMREDKGDLGGIPAVRISDTSDDVLRGIRDIYYQLTFGNVKEDWGDSDLHALRDLLDRRSYMALKSGGGAKLQLRRCRGGFRDEVVGFDFNPNLGKDERGYAEGEKKVIDFRTRAIDYLATKGVLFTAPDLKY